MGLSEALADKDKKSKIVADCTVLIDQEVDAKGGLSSIPLKAGYKAVKGIKPGFISHVLENLLPEFATKVDPIWAEGVLPPPADRDSRRREIRPESACPTDSVACGKPRLDSAGRPRARARSGCRE